MYNTTQMPIVNKYSLLFKNDHITICWKSKPAEDEMWSVFENIKKDFPDFRVNIQDFDWRTWKLDQGSAL